MNRVFEKKINAEYDAEMLTLTTAILSKNPDISTLWNLRRECILLIFEADPSTNIFIKDLDFTESCLLVNSKSYCVWHHRCWLLETSAEPNWQKEVEVCTKYLKLDERNCKFLLQSSFLKKNIIYSFIYFSPRLGL